MKKIPASQITQMAIPHLIEKGYIADTPDEQEMTRLNRFTEVILRPFKLCCSICRFCRPLL